jgi:DNA-binding CsgD family transcriptional regulator/tetratricopeptide (TPR) repeat protein
VSQRGDPFVGRDDALERLSSALSRAAAGEGSIVLVYGEAGIGKTRLCEQAGHAHRSRGGPVLVGRAAPEETAIAYGPIADALRAGRRSEPALWEAVTCRADVLSAVVPELAGGAAGGERRYADRPVLFEALLDAVEESAQADRAVLWVLDDVHWADDASWHFIAYAARRVAAMSLVLAVSYREEEIGPASPRWPSLVQLKRDPHVVSLPLGRLSAADAERLVTALAPDLRPELITEIIERSVGTPLLTEALADMAANSGALPELPDVALATVRERAARLTPAGRDLLDLAAVAGLTVEGQLLASLRNDAGIGELVAVGLLDRDGGGYRFCHPLLRDAALAEVPAVRQRHLHTELAGALTRAGQAMAERVAGHLERAGQPAAALATLEQAAAAAQRAGDVGRGATLYLAALGVARTHEALRPQRDRLQSTAIAQLLMARRWTELAPLIGDAWARRETLPGEERAWLAEVLAWQVFAQGHVAAAWQLIQEELALLDHCGASRNAANLQGQAGYIAWLRGDPERASQHAQKGLEIAARTGYREAAWWVRHHQTHIGYRRTGDRQTAIEGFRDVTAAARELGITDGEALAAWDLACHTAAPYDIDAAAAAAEKAGAVATGNDLQILRAAVLLLEGNADAAEALLTRFARRAQLSEPVAAPWVAVSKALLHLHRGELAEARSELQGLESVSEASQTEYHLADRAAALGWLSWEEGRWADAAGHLATSARLWRTGFWHTLAGGPLFACLHVDALLRLGQPAEAHALAGQLPDGGQGARFYDASQAAARFRLDPGATRAAEARSAAASAPWPWVTALTMMWQGEFLGDTEAADGGAVLFGGIGAPLGARRAERVLRRMGVRPARQQAGPLSERELEVAQLVAEGLSNPAIAARLFLSRPTVASHITHILTKLGFSSRAQIAAWVARQSST